MIFLGLYSGSIFSIGQRAEQTPQEKHFLMCSPQFPGDPVFEFRVQFF